jgi:hypothetical protein
MTPPRAVFSRRVAFREKYILKNFPATLLKTAREAVGRF